MARRFTSKSPNTFPISICSFVGQRLPLPLVPANQEQLRREAGLFPDAMLLTIPHRPKLRMPIIQALSRIRRVYFEELPSQNFKYDSKFRSTFLRAATAKSPASIHHLWAERPVPVTSAPSSQQHYLLPTSSQQPIPSWMSNRTHDMLRMCPPFAMAARTRTRRGKPKARCTTTVERDQSQAPSRTRLLGG